MNDTVEMLIDALAYEATRMVELAGTRILEATASGDAVELERAYTAHRRACTARDNLMDFHLNIHAADAALEVM